MRSKKDKQEDPVVEVAQPSEKETLLALYEDLKARGIRSISDLEGQIARAE